MPFAQACFSNSQRCPEAIALHGLNHRDLMAPRCRYGECTGIFVLLCSIFKRHKKLSNSIYIYIHPQSWKDCLALSFQSWISRSNRTAHIKIMLIPNISQQPRGHLLMTHLHRPRSCCFRRCSMWLMILTMWIHSLRPSI